MEVLANIFKYAFLFDVTMAVILFITAASWFRAKRRWDEVTCKSF